MINSQSLPKTLTVQIEKNEYEIKFPTNGQFLEIQSLKHQYAGGQGTYSDMKSSNDELSQYAAMTIDMMSTFNTLIPGLKKDLTVKALAELDMIQVKSLLDIYAEEYLPWFNDWMKIITAPKAKETEEKSQNLG